MGEFVTVGNADEIAEGEAKAFMIENAEIAVARSEGTLYAFSDICTHQQCNL
jgi:nitrite reductase/ring-hydroxylating ferredoxin subunit